jgi:hypothetical protein
VKAWGKLPRWAAALRVKLLCIESKGAGEGQQLLAQHASPVAFTHQGQGGDEPEGAGGESPLFAGEAVIGLLGPVAEYKPVFGEFGRDGFDSGPDPGVIGREEADQGHEKQ